MAKRPLTARQQQAADLYLQGLTLVQIAKRMGVRCVGALLDKARAKGIDLPVRARGRPRRQGDEL
jgi:transposase